LKEPLPSRFYGTHHYLSKRRLRAFTGTFEDIRGVVAEMLLNVDPSKVVLEYTPDDAAVEDQLLGAFPTGKLFQQYSEDAKNYGTINGKPVVPLCFGVWADETTTSSSRNTSELPVYIALLNAGKLTVIRYTVLHAKVFFIELMTRVSSLSQLGTPIRCIFWDTPHFVFRILTTP
jgi:hypothetical protein